MFSKYRTQKNIQLNEFDYKTLYLQEKRLKQQYQRRAQIAQLKYRKLAQSINKKCVRCFNMEEKKNKENVIMELKRFTNGFNLANIDSVIKLQHGEKYQYQKTIKNFGVFGLPESILIQPEGCEGLMQGEMIYVADIPTMAQEHTAKLSFPSGIRPQYFTGLEARQKAIQIMSSSSSNAKSFIMSFQTDECSINANEKSVLNLMNPHNRLFAICLAVDDFSLVPNWSTELIASDREIGKQKNQMLSSMKVLSCEETDISYHNEKDCRIAVASRVYCIFSYYPFFTFYQQILKAIINSVKTQRLVIYRESSCELAEADSHFFLQRIKETYKEISFQIQHWEMKLARQYEVKMRNSQKISLLLNSQSCGYNFIQDWGLSIISMFNVDSFLDAFTLMMLEQKIVFVSENPTILTFAIHLFTQLLPKPFQYPFPVINLLPQNEGYFSTPCPFVYGTLGSKKNIASTKIIENTGSLFIVLQKQGAQIILNDTQKNILKKKKSKCLKEILFPKFKFQHEKNRRVSNLMFTDQEINFIKDKQGICLDIIKSINLYLTEQVLQRLPKPYEVNHLLQKLAVNGLKPGQDLHQVTFQKIKKQCSTNSKDQFFIALLETQIISTYLFR